MIQLPAARCVSAIDLTFDGPPLHAACEAAGNEDEGQPSKLLVNEDNSGMGREASAVGDDVACGLPDALLFIANTICVSFKSWLINSFSVGHILSIESRGCWFNPRSQHSFAFFFCIFFSFFFA